MGGFFYIYCLFYCMPLPIYTITNSPFVNSHFFIIFVFIDKKNIMRDLKIVKEFHKLQKEFFRLVGEENKLNIKLLNEGEKPEETEEFKELHEKRRKAEKLMEEFEQKYKNCLYEE
jgi:hypothetical protein